MIPFIGNFLSPFGCCNMDGALVFVIARKWSEQEVVLLIPSPKKQGAWFRKQTNYNVYHEIRKGVTDTRSFFYK